MGQLLLQPGNPAKASTTDFWLAFRNGRSIVSALRLGKNVSNPSREIAVSSSNVPAKCLQVFFFVNHSHIQTACLCFLAHFVSRVKRALLVLSATLDKYLGGTVNLTSLSKNNLDSILLFIRLSNFWLSNLCPLIRSSIYEYTITLRF